MKILNHEIPFFYLFLIISFLSIFIIKYSRWNQLKMKQAQSHQFGESHKPIEIGDRIKLWGGYDYDPRWLVGKSHHIGFVIKKIPSQNSGDAIVIELDDEINIKEGKGKYIILETRYEGQTWNEYGPVHVELCDFIPDSLPFNERKQGKWIEAAASYEMINIDSK